MTGYRGERCPQCGRVLPAVSRVCVNRNARGEPCGHGEHGHGSDSKGSRSTPCSHYGPDGPCGCPKFIPETTAAPAADHAPAGAADPPSQAGAA